MWICFTFHLFVYFSNHGYVWIGKLLGVHHAFGLLECDYWFHTILHIHDILDSFFPIFHFYVHYGL
jgi:hypothetical protein